MINKIIQAFKKQNAQLYFVGGFVRDKLMNIESNDIDFATNLLPEEIIELAKFNNLNYRYTDNSIAHGTIVVENFEITTFRKDVSCDGRNATIEFAKTIEEDLSRRDFTINAIAINAYEYNLIDPFKGIDDIHYEIIRAVGNPYERLKEDKLRTLRAIRFANRFGFEIEEGLFSAIKNVDISNLSVERIRDEFLKILECNDKKYLNIIIERIIPEFSGMIGAYGGTKHNETLDSHSYWAMFHMKQVSSNSLDRLIALLHDIGKIDTIFSERIFKGHEDVGAEKVKKIMEHMKFSNEDIEYAYHIVKNHMIWHFYSGKLDKSIKKAIRKLPENRREEMINTLFKLCWSDEVANLRNKYISFNDYKKRMDYEKVISLIHEEKIIKMKIDFNGHDLIRMGLRPSPLFSKILKDVETKILDKELGNDKMIIEKYIRQKYYREI